MSQRKNSGKPKKVFKKHATTPPGCWSSKDKRVDGECGETKEGKAEQNCFQYLEEISSLFNFVVIFTIVLYCDSPAMVLCVLRNCTAEIVKSTASNHHHYLDVDFVVNGFLVFSFLARRQLPLPLTKNAYCIQALSGPKWWNPSGFENNY